MRIYSWNVNGVRAVANKGLEHWLDTTRPDVLCLQETRAEAAVVPESLRHLAGYESYWSPLPKLGYSGVATFCRQPASAWQAGIGLPDFDDEHRVLITVVGDLSIYNVYFPNGRSSAVRLAYKLAFYDAFLAHIDAATAAGRRLLFCGDVNTAHRPIDLARPAANSQTSGFLPAERAWIDRCLAHGWVDTFRHLHPETKGAYTWWLTRAHARERNIGWRLDYCFIHQRDVPRLRGAGIAANVMGSDHCPIWVELEG
jgi:exodeoxyribonuclease-3